MIRLMWALTVSYTHLVVVKILKRFTFLRSYTWRSNQKCLIGPAGVQPDYLLFILYCTTDSNLLFFILLVLNWFKLLTFCYILPLLNTFAGNCWPADFTACYSHGRYLATEADNMAYIHQVEGLTLSMASLNLLFSDDDVSVLWCNYYVLQYYDDVSRSGLVIAGRLAVDRHVGHLTLTPTLLLLTALFHIG